MQCTGLRTSSCSAPGFRVWAHRDWGTFCWVIRGQLLVLWAQQGMTCEETEIFQPLKIRLCPHSVSWKQVGVLKNLPWAGFGFIALKMVHFGMLCFPSVAFQWSCPDGEQRPAGGRVSRSPGGRRSVRWALGKWPFYCFRLWNTTLASVLAVCVSVRACVVSVLFSVFLQEDGAKRVCRSRSAVCPAPEQGRPGRPFVAATGSAGPGMTKWRFVFFLMEVSHI